MSFKFNPFTGTLDIVTDIGGTDGQIQYNDNGVLNGATQLVYDDAQNFTGIQKTTPEAPLHVTGATGQTVAAPTNLVATLVEDTAVTVPTSGSATIVYGPADLGGSVYVNFTYIDQVNGATTSQFIGGNYVCNGQTIYYRIYGYRVSGSTLVVHPTSYPVSFTDVINDGTTTFAVDFTGISTALGTVDGYIIEKSYDGSNWPYSVDIGSSTSYQDNDFTSSVSWEVSAYIENGGTWYNELAQYNTINGTIYSSSAVQGSNTDSNNGQAIILNVSASNSLTEQGCIAQQNNGLFRDIGATTSYNDWGSSTGTTSPYTVFNSVAFPTFNTSLTGSSSSTAAFNYDWTTYLADGSLWSIEVWEYRFHPETAEKWFVSMPDTYSLGADNGSFSNFSIDWSCTPGDGDGRHVVVLQNGSGVYDEDVGTNTSGNLSALGSISAKQSITSYTGISRTFTIYGKQVSPTVKYSTSGYSYNFTDSNLAPYFIHHSWPGGGNATYFKVIEASYRSGNLYDNVVVSSYDQTAASFTYDTIVSPTTLGYLANGSTLNRTYSAYAYKTIYSTVVYSSTAPTTTTTDPNDGKYYKVSLTWNAVTGASYKLKRTTGITSVYYNVGTNSLVDTTANVWASSSTITPTYAPTSAAIFERSLSGTSEPPQIILRNLVNSYLSLLKFERYTGTQSLETGRIAITSAGNFHFNCPTSVFYLGNEISPYIILGTQTTFNNTNTGNGFLQFKSGTNNYLLYADALTNTIYCGNSNSAWGSNPNTTAYIQATSNVNAALVLTPSSGASDSTPLFKIMDTTGSVKYLLTNSGRVGIGGANPTSAYFSVIAGNSSNAQLQLDASSALATVAGGISFQGGYFHGGDGSGTMRKFLQTPASYTATSFAYVDSNGLLVADNRLIWNGTILQSNQTLEIVSGLLQFPTANAVKVGKTISTSNTTDIIVGIGNTGTGTHEGNTVFGRACSSSGQRGFVAGASCSQTGGGNSFIVAGYGASFSGSNGGSIGINIANSTSNSLMLGMASDRFLSIDTNTASTHRVINKATAASSTVYYDADATSLSGIRLYRSAVLKWTISNNSTDVFYISGAGGAYITGAVNGRWAINQNTTLSNAVWHIKNITNTTDEVLSLQHFASATANFINCKTSTGTSVCSVSSAGTITAAGVAVTDANNITFGTTTGTKLGAATSQKLSFWNATPIIQPTTGVAAATLVGGGGTTITATDTFDGYTIQQVVKALRNIGLLA